MTGAQLRRSIYGTVLLTVLVPPFLGGSLMGFAGFYPMPEFYLAFFHLTGAYFAAVLATALALTPRALRFVKAIAELPTGQARARTRWLVARVPWLLLFLVTAYSVIGVITVDWSLQDLGYAEYTLAEHLLHQAGLVPVLLVTIFPVYSYFSDSLGRYLAPRGIHVNAAPLWVKLLMLGIVTPLLIDTLLVGYFYNHTGYFQAETLAIWLTLLLLAAGGTLLGMDSFRQALAPLRAFVQEAESTGPPETMPPPLSLDELGLLSARLGDITRTLRLSEAKLNEAQRIARVGNWELDLRSGSLSWSDEIFRLFEIDESRFAASYEAFLAAIHPDDRELVDARYRRSLQEREPYTVVHRLLMPDGRIKWVEERCSTDFAEDGTPLVSRGTVQDVTERYELERQLRQLNERLEQRVAYRTAELQEQNERNEAVLRTTPDGFFAADSEGRLSYVNPAFCRLLGYTEGEMAALSVSDIEAVETAAGVVAHMARIERLGYDRFETRHRCKDGTEVDVEVSVSYVSAGGHPSFFTFVRDISERKRNEEAVRLAREEAERANAAKTDFLSRMSHELRTPLNAILGFGQLLQSDSERPLDDVQAEQVGEMVQAGEHLLALVNEVLNLSRIERGEQESRSEALSAAPLVSQCLRQLEPLAVQRSITLDAQLAEDCCRVVADPMRLRQVLLNLLSNAIKYNREGGTVQVYCSVVGNGVARISVEDSGPGITPENEARIFLPFERLENAYEGVEGTGIGLAVVKMLIEAMGGRVGVDSTVGSGSTFWFELPAA